jgi:hypothetical protein
VFLGHFAVGLAAKRAAPSVSLGTLFLACQLADLLWPNLVLAGVERFAIAPGATAVTPLDFVHYPFSHSLAALALWGALFGGACALLARRGALAGLVVGAVVLSHWVLDAVSHRPDVPIGFGGETKVGLGLWNSVAATVAVETLLLAAGIAAYLSATRARDRAGSAGLWSLLAALFAISLANLFSPPPPSTTAVAWTAQAMWLFVAWAYWVDRHRETRRPAAARAR